MAFRDPSARVFFASVGVGVGVGVGWAVIALGLGCDARPKESPATAAQTADAAATTPSASSAPSTPSAPSTASTPAAEADAGVGFDTPFRSGNNRALLRGTRLPNRAADDAKLRREVRVSLAPSVKGFAVGPAYVLRPGTGADQVQKRIDGQSVVEMAVVAKLTNTTAAAQCNVRVSADLRDAKGAASAGVILRERIVLGDVGGFRNDPSKMTVLGARPGINLHRNCIGAGDSGYAFFSGNVPLASLEAIASIEMKVDTWAGEPPPLVGPKTQVLPLDYAYATDPANAVTIQVRNTGARAAAVRGVQYVVLDERDAPLFVGWTSPTAAPPGIPDATVNVGPGETLKTDDSHNIRIAYQGHGGTKMLAWVDFVDAP